MGEWAHMKRRNQKWTNVKSTIYDYEKQISVKTVLHMQYDHNLH